MKKLLSKPSVLLPVSVVLLILCFLMNRYFKIEQTPWNVLQYALTLLLIIVSLIGLSKGISQAMTGRKKEAAASELDSEHPIKIWSQEDLFAYLAQEDIIDLDIDHPVVRRIGAASDLRRNRLTGQNELFDKAYYINGQEYADFAEFKEQFAAVHPEAEVRILRASMDDGSMDIKLP